VRLTTDLAFDFGVRQRTQVGVGERVVANNMPGVSKTLQKVGMLSRPIALEEEHRADIIFLQSFEQMVSLLGRSVIIKGQEDRVTGFVTALFDLPVAAPHINIPLEQVIER